MESHLIIREARRRARLTQAELARRARTTQSAIARWETGKSQPSWEKLQELVACCGLELSISLGERRDADDRALDARLGISPAERLRRLVAALPFVAGGDGSDATGFAGDDPPFDPRSLLERLVLAEVRFVLIGGLAAVLHGSPFLTEDVDITPAGDSANLERLAAALASMDARLAGGAPGAARQEQPIPAMIQAVAIARLVTKFGRLDLVWEPAGTSGFEDLRVHARDTDLGGLSAPLASLPDVIRSKEAAGRSDDRTVVPVLRRLARRAAAARTPLESEGAPGAST